jgi:hypothetical protein
MASDRRLTCRLAESNEEPAGALNDAVHARAGSMLTESVSIGMTVITNRLTADGRNHFHHHPPAGIGASFLR